MSAPPPPPPPPPKRQTTAWSQVVQTKLQSMNCNSNVVCSSSGGGQSIGSPVATTMTMNTMATSSRMNYASSSSANNSNSKNNGGQQRHRQQRQKQQQQQTRGNGDPQQQQSLRGRNHHNNNNNHQHHVHAGMTGNMIGNIQQQQQQRKQEKQQQYQLKQPQHPQGRDPRMMQQQQQQQQQQMQSNGHSRNQRKANASNQPPPAMNQQPQLQQPYPLPQGQMGEMTNNDSMSSPPPPPPADPSTDPCNAASPNCTPWQQSQQHPPLSQHPQQPFPQQFPNQHPHPHPQPFPPQQQPSPYSPLNTPQYTYVWDPQNTQRFLATRDEMLRILFRPKKNDGNDEDEEDSGDAGRNGRIVREDNVDMNSNDDGNDLVKPTTTKAFVRSHSAHAQVLPMSPTRPEDYKRYSRAVTTSSCGGVGGVDGAALPPLSPPDMPRLSASARVGRTTTRRPGGSDISSGIGGGRRKGGLERQATAPPFVSSSKPQSSKNPKPPMTSISDPATNMFAKVGGGAMPLPRGPTNGGITSPRSSPKHNHLNSSSNSSNSSDNASSSSSSSSYMDSYDRTMHLLNELLPLPRDYFCMAIRCLMMDTPLPMVGMPPSSSVDGHGHHSFKKSNKTSYTNNNRAMEMQEQEIRARPPHSSPHPPNNSNNNSNSNNNNEGELESIYLLPRYYLAKWMHWTRNMIMHISTDCFFGHFARFDEQMSQMTSNHLRMSLGGESGGSQHSQDGDIMQQQQPLSGSNDGNHSQQHQQPHQHHHHQQQSPPPPSSQQQSPFQKRTYSLLPEALKALAALSILSDQYQLYEDDNDTTQNWILWLEELGQCWNEWSEGLRGFHCFCLAQQRQQQAQGVPMNQRNDGMQCQNDGMQLPNGLEMENGDDETKNHHDGYNNSNNNNSMVAEGEKMERPHLHHSHSGNSNNNNSFYNSNDAPSSEGTIPPSPQVIMPPAPPPPPIVPPPYPHLMYPPFPHPGPVDCRILSMRSNVLMMHPHVALVMRGVWNSCHYQNQNDGNGDGNDGYHDNNYNNGDGNNYNSNNDSEDNEEIMHNDNNNSSTNIQVLSPSMEASESLLANYIDSLWDDDPLDDPYAINYSHLNTKKKLAVSPVPEGFYEFLKSHHGVRCENGEVCFSSLNGGDGDGDGSGDCLDGVNVVAGLAGGNNNNHIGAGVNSTATSATAVAGKSSNSFSSSSSLLFHDQWEVHDGNMSKRSNGDNYNNQVNESNVNGGSMKMNHHPQSQSPSPPGATCRPIEFRRRILPVPYSKPNQEDNLDKEQSYLNNNIAAKKEKKSSPYSKLMQEAIQSKKSFAEQEKRKREKDSKRRNPWLTVDTTTTMNGEDEDGNTSEEDDCSNVAYTVEVFPVELQYRIVDGDNDGGVVPTTATTVNGSASEANNTNESRENTSVRSTKQNSHRQGIALASRSSLAHVVLRDLQRAAAPPHCATNSCVRLWRKSSVNNGNGDNGGGATKSGDGYELLDISSLSPAPSWTGPSNSSSSSGSTPRGTSPKSTTSKTSRRDESQSQSLTMEKWLGLEPLFASNKRSLHNRRLQQQPSDGNGNQGVGGTVVELLVEVRPSPTAKWVREPLELHNRLQVGDFVDAQDSARKWYEAIVREVKPDTVKVHYFGWGSKWDAELPRRKGVTSSKLLPPAPLWSKTSKWREQIRVGDEVEIRESTSLVQRPKWHRAKVLAVGRETDPPRELEGNAELERLDINERGKKVPLMLLRRKNQILVEVPQEMHNLSKSTPLTPPRNTNSSDSDYIPAAQPPYRRWVNLYGEEICKVNTHKTANKKQSNSPATLNYTMESERAPVEVMKPYNNIHGSGFVRESLRGIPPAAGTVGLHNLGNSCYMNSILQCINHIKPITQYFLKGDYLKEINKNNPLGSGGRVATAYASFLNEIYSGEYSILAPRLLKQTVACFAPQFNNNYQHDSQEFCQYLMDGLHEDLNRVKTKPYVEHMEAYGMEDGKAAMESWKKHLLRHDSIFVDYTQGMHRSHLTCPSCGRESIKFDVYSSISLPLVPAKNRTSIPLKDCLDQFAAGEQLDEHNAWYCSTCKKHVCALKLITLWNTPDILVLHLKRFTFEKCPTVDGRILRRKIEERVDFPIDRLDLSSYILGPKDPDAPPVYKLFGVSEHTGSTANSGHYTATVRNSEDGNWYRYNDSNVGSTSGDAAMTGGAYLLFYQRVKGSLRWAGMEKQMMQQVNNINGPAGTPAGEDSDGFREVTGKKKKKKP